MSDEQNTDLLLDIIWPDASSQLNIQLTSHVDASLHEKLTSPETPLLSRDISCLSSNENNVLIINELRRVLVDTEKNSLLETKLNRIIASSILNGHDGGTENKSLVKKRTRGPKPFKKMNLLEEFKPVILSSEAENKPHVTPVSRTIDSFQLIDLSEDSRNLAKNV